MKNFAKILSLGTLLAASVAAAHAAPITGTIGFGGNGTYNNVTEVFTAGTPTFSGTDAYVNVNGTGTLSPFTAPNAATFFTFNASTATTTAPVSVFTMTEAGSTVSFAIMGVTSSIVGTSGPELTGFGLLSETGYTATLSTFTLSTNAGAGTFISFNTAVPAATPEPSSLILLGTGLLGAGGTILRRRRLA